MEYRPETPADKVLERLERLSACSEAMTWCNQYAGKPLGKLADNILDERFNQSWAGWYLVIFGEASSPEIRRKFIQKIKDTMVAFSLYLRLAWLTDEEDKLLEAKFKGKLPTAEAELAQGIVKRKKV